MPNRLSDLPQLVGTNTESIVEHWLQAVSTTPTSAPFPSLIPSASKICRFYCK